MNTHLEKFKNHPLLQHDKGSDLWSFKQEQVPVVLLANQMTEWDSDRVLRFFERARLDAAKRQDIAAAFVESANSLADERQTIDVLQSRLAVLRSAKHPESAIASEGSRMAGVIALTTVERLLPRGSSHESRAALLLKLGGGQAIRGLTFSGTIARYDFRATHFEECRLDNVAFANCKFDENTRFVRCQFAGGIPPTHCVGFGTVQTVDCRLDIDADALFNNARVNEGRKRYSAEDLQNDIRSVLSKFIIKGGIGLKTVSAPNLRRGSIGTSRHRDDVLEVLGALVFEEHPISAGPSGYNMRVDAEEAVKFYAANNVFTGPIRDAYERLRSRLKLIEP